MLKYITLFFDYLFHGYDRSKYLDYKLRYSFMRAKNIAVYPDKFVLYDVVITKQTIKGLKIGQEFGTVWCKPNYYDNSIELYCYKIRTHMNAYHFGLLTDEDEGDKKVTVEYMI